MLAKSTTVRNTAGTTYYGIADMSGNVHEICMGITQGNIHQAFSRNKVGDGDLAANGAANINDTPGGTWPDYTNTTTAVGLGLKGGGYNTTAALSYRLRVSDRSFIRNAVTGMGAWRFDGTNRPAGVGGRGVR